MGFQTPRPTMSATTTAPAYKYRAFFMCLLFGGQFPFGGQFSPELKRKQEESRSNEPADEGLTLEVVVRVDVNCTMFQDESNVITAVIAQREFRSKHTCHFVLIRMIGVVKHAVYT